MTMPRPVGRTPGGPRPVGAVDPNKPHVALETLARPGYAPSLRPARVKMQIAGDSNSGKTFAYLMKAQTELVKAREAGVEPPYFFVIDTDDTLPVFLNTGYEFEHLYVENGGNVVPCPAFDWASFASAVRYAQSNAKMDDWIVVDVINRAYDYAQEFIAQKYNLVLEDEIAERSGLGGGKRLGFGAFDADKWQLVTLTFEAVIKPIIQSQKTHSIFVSHITDMQSDAGREKREPMVLFDQLGVKPRGAPKIPGLVNTIVFLWNVRAIQKNERGQRVKAETVRNLTIVKDRGNVVYWSDVYDKDLFAKLDEIRAKQRGRNTNITAPAEVQASIEAARAALLATTDPGDNPVGYTSSSAQPQSVDSDRGVDPDTEDGGEDADD